MHVDDLADASVYLMNNYNSPDTINVDVSEDVTIKKLAEMAKDTVGFKGKLIFNTTKPDGTPRKLLDVSRLKQSGWKVELGMGIKTTYQWFTDNVDVYRS